MSKRMKKKQIKKAMGTIVMLSREMEREREAAIDRAVGNVITLINLKRMERGEEPLVPVARKEA